MTSARPARPETIAFRLHKRFAAPPERVFRAWTDPEALMRWWCPPGWSPAGIEFDLRRGGTYRIGMSKSDGSSTVVRGSFLEVDAPRRLVYTWNWENAFEGMPETQVTIEFLANNGATDVTLIHERLPEIQVCLRHRAGWIAALGRVEQILGSLSS